MTGPDIAVIVVLCMVAFIVWRVLALDKPGKHRRKPGRKDSADPNWEWWREESWRD